MSSILHRFFSFVVTFLWCFGFDFVFVWSGKLRKKKSGGENELGENCTRCMRAYVFSFFMIVTCIITNIRNQKPITPSDQLPCARVKARFSRTSLFFERFWREF